MRIYLGIPFYGGAGAEFVSSLLKTHAALHLANYEVEVDMVSNCSVLPKARNEIVMRFLACGFDKLLFLDTDMVWNAVDIFKLISSEHGVCALDYRKKAEKEEYTATRTGEEREGWAQAVGAGAGLMCITREALVTLTQECPETRYSTDDGQVCFALFDFKLWGGRYYGEDYTFCRRWVECGNDIAILMGAETKHIGTKAYGGSR